MEAQHPEECGCCASPCDHGPASFTANIMCAAQSNRNFRTAFWTGCHMQMTLMCIPPCCDIGPEMHPDTEQCIRVECGRALVCMGPCKDDLSTQCCLNPGDAVFVPEGTWHNIRNIANCPLKLSSIYTPPRHPRGTIHCTKADARETEC